MQISALIKAQEATGKTRCLKNERNSLPALDKVSSDC
jgi:hypothetical protein